MVWFLLRMDVGCLAMIVVCISSFLRNFDSSNENLEAMLDYEIMRLVKHDVCTQLIIV